MSAWARRRLIHGPGASSIPHSFSGSARLNPPVVRESVAKGEAAHRGLRILENVSLLRADHFKIQNVVPRMRGIAAGKASIAVQSTVLVLGPDRYGH